MIDKVYALSGTLIHGISEEEDEIILIAIFDSFEKAIKYLEDLEADKENYRCWECDYNLSDSLYNGKYKDIEFTDEHFKHKICPNCSNKIEFSPECRKYDIQEYCLNDEDGGNTVYDCEYDEEKKQIKEIFEDDRDFSYREVNTKIRLDPKKSLEIKNK